MEPNMGPSMDAISDALSLLDPRIMDVEFSREDPASWVAVANGIVATCAYPREKDFHTSAPCATAEAALLDLVVRVIEATRPR